MSARILIVDDERNVRRMLRALLESESYEVEETTSTEVQDAIGRFDPHVLLLDLIMPGGPDGLTVLSEVQQTAPQIVVIMMSGKAGLADAVSATRLGAFQFLEKPLLPESVLVTVAAAHEIGKTRAENIELRSELRKQSDLVGKSTVLERIRELVIRVASTPSRVLITGESGTGKELIAREIHRRSPRSEKPMVCVNCAAIPRDLIESELFGHERGAFTGASEKRRGRFELADGGTLFLDEVGDLSSEAQAKLLRVLETGTFERVGGERSHTVDVRVVAATNRDLEAAAREGKFREDLLYRLNVFPIHVPPLRDRRDDVPLLAVHFAGITAKRSGRPEPRFTTAALKRLTRYDWPGNVREVGNAIERLMILGGQTIDAHDVDGVLGRVENSEPPSAGLTEALAAYEKRLIESALQKAAGNVAEAARRLATDRANLYRRMRRLGVGETRERVD